MKPTMPRAAVREESVMVNGLAKSFGLLPDGGPDLKAMVMAAWEGLEKIEPFAPSDTIYERNMKAAREAVNRIRNEETPDEWDLDKALRLIGQATFSCFESPAPTKHDDGRPAARSAKQPVNVLTTSGARAVYKARLAPK
jgi:hypothetical protein